MADTELIDPSDYENGVDNPTLNYIETSVIYVQSKKEETEPSTQTIIFGECLPIKPDNMSPEDDSSSDSIEVLTLDESMPRAKMTQRRQRGTYQNETDNKDENYTKNNKNDKKEKQEKSKDSKEVKYSKTEFDRKNSINIFEEQYSFWDLLQKPQPNFSVIDPREDLLKFLFSPPPKDVYVKCQLNKTNRKDKTMLFTKFIFSLQINDENDSKDLLTLMAARSRKKSRTLNYIISTDASEMKSNSSTLIGKMKGNFLGTKFEFFRNKRPTSSTVSNDEDNDCLADSESDAGSCSPQMKNIQIENLGTAFYKSTSFMKRKPREVDVAIPEWKAKEEQYSSDITLPNDRSELATASKDCSNIHIFNNIEPTYDKDMKCFTLNFGGRAKRISAKNFALMNKAEKERRVYQFGKCKDHYIIDYTYPLCAFQAFAIGLSSCHRKITSD